MCVDGRKNLGWGVVDSIGEIIGEYDGNQVWWDRREKILCDDVYRT